PYSITDKLVLGTEEYINGKLKKKLPESGQDVKVMASRIGNKITLTVACAMVDKYIEDESAYKSAVEQLYNSALDNALKIVGSQKVDIDLFVNTGDDYKKKVYYLTCTGMSQEMGDDGSVGRGNRCNGLITPFRPMSMEATSGKNPITHIGKIYNILSKLIADDIAKSIGGDAEIRIRLLSQIGKPVSEPLNASIDIVTAGADTDPRLPKWKSEAEAIATDWLNNIDKVTELIITGKVRTF
ncbi:MAG: methionine adenosyltransferase, partial [Methanomassiliicoccaceae archaeon]|nr:methionine adenosyltransferase [Methanomassiliicoccaceae archaeon]